MDISRKIKLARFWIVAFFIIIKNVMRGNEWTRITVNFDYGKDSDGVQIRKNLVADKNLEGMHIYWQDLYKMRMVENEWTKKT